MKFIVSLLITFAVFTNSVHAETLISCKKRNSLVYSSFYWVQIDKNNQGELTFYYGNGVDSQMVDVYFTSPINQTADGKFEFQNEQYFLTSEIINSKLSFTINNKTQTVTRNEFICE